MPENLITRRYYPVLSKAVDISKIPESLGFVKNGIEKLLGQLHYKDLQFHQSAKGDTAFYSLQIVSPRRIALELPCNIELVLNPDNTGNDFSISTFPITVEYKWKLLAYIRDFKDSKFAFTPQDFFELGLLLIGKTEEEVISHFLNHFVIPNTSTIKPLQQFVADINSVYNLTIPNPDENTKVKEVINQIYEAEGKYIIQLI